MSDAGRGNPLPAAPDSRGPERAVAGVATEELVLAELVSRVLDRGVMVAGDVTISIAGVDLVHLALRLRLSSSETLRQHQMRIGATVDADDRTREK